MNLSTRIAASTALLVLSGAALAQTAPIAGIPAAPTFTIPAPPCERPPTTAGLNPTPDMTKRFNKNIDAYKKCMVDYQHSLSDYVKAYTAVVNQLVDQSNKNMSDFNAYAAQVRKDNDMDDDDDASDNKAPAKPAGKM